jgi:glycosyltransferase involved in cell wall biosynthesis
MESFPEAPAAPDPVRRPGGGEERRSVASAGRLLCVVNYPANTGYAWDFIESLYADVADALAGRGIETLIAYPAFAGAPRGLQGRSARAVALDVHLSGGKLLELLRFVRAMDVRALYLSDRPAWHPGYALLHAVGVRRILSQDHTSGARTPPRGLKRVLKRASRRVHWMLADDVVAVSDFVARRKREVDLVPARRVHRIYNALAPSEATGGEAVALRAELGISPDRLMVACACRASPEKGVAVLLSAFQSVLARWPGARPRPALVYLGDGPDAARLHRLRDESPARHDMYLAGYRSNARELIGGADIAVVPSVWDEAFGLAALEPMSRGVPVVASRTGGLPEVVLDDETGVLVPAGDADALASALQSLLLDEPRRRQLGEAGRIRARRAFHRDAQVAALVALLEGAFRDR